jgi:enamine deaminase RidA (YjgF/YER057c/UK114 family)
MQCFTDALQGGSTKWICRIKKSKPVRLLKLTVLIVDPSQERLEVFGEELHRVWGSAAKPACTLTPVPSLALDNLLFEIEATAAVAV